MARAPLAGRAPSGGQLSCAGRVFRRTVCASNGYQKLAITLPGDAKGTLSVEQLRSEAENFDRLVHRHARHRVIGAAAEDHVPLPLTTQRLTRKDRRTLAELFRKQSEMYRELADSLDHERP